MSCGHCQSDAVVIDDVIEGIPIPRCYVCGWRLLVPDEPPLVDSHQANRAAKLKAWGERQEAQGMCRNCCEPVVEGYKYCADHLEFHQNRCEQMRQQGVV